MYLERVIIQQSNHLSLTLFWMIRQILSFKIIPKLALSYSLSLSNVFEEVLLFIT